MDRGTILASSVTIGSLLGVVFMIRYITSPSSLPGDTLWTFSLPSPTSGQLMVSAVTGYLMFLDATFTLKALECSQVVTVWSFASPNSMSLFGPPVEYGQLQLVPSTEANGQLYAIAAVNGSVVWNRTVGASTALSKVAVVRPWAGSAFFTTAVYFGAGNNFASFNLTSMQLQWSFASGGVVDSPPAYSPQYNLVIGGSRDEHVYGLDARNGSAWWTIPVSGQVISSPLVWNGVVYVACSDGSVLSLNIVTGSQMWGANPGGGAIRTPLVLSRGLLLVGTDGGSIFALSMASGASSWSFQVGNGGAVSSVTTNGNDVFASTISGAVAAVMLATGEAEWSLQTADFSNSTSVVIQAYSLIVGGAHITAVQTIVPPF